MSIPASSLRVRRVISLALFCWMLVGGMPAGAQTNSDGQNATPEPKSSHASSDASNGNNVPQTQAPVPGSQYSGMYSFLRDGEFVQITVEDQGHVTGFVSRYGDSESDRDVFLDHFFKSGKLDGNQLAFTTETVHGVSYEFRGTIEPGSGKNPGDEAYYVLKGTLIDNIVDDPKADDPKTDANGRAKKDNPKNADTNSKKTDTKKTDTKKTDTKKDTATPTDAAKVSARSRQVVLNSFPQDVGTTPTQKN